MRVLGLDVGAKTIGLALSDETALVASPLVTLVRRGVARDVDALAALAREHGVVRFVVGLPLDLDGSVGVAARRVLPIARALRAAGFAVDTWDERFSTVAAERVLIDADLSRRRRKEVIDKVAAAYVLQGWLDAQRAQGRTEEAE